jgi:tyrosinase
MDVRKSASALTPAERAMFVDAIIGLKHAPSVLHPGDATRGRYDDFVEVHLNAMMAMMMGQPSWGHQAPAFGPWHRVLLRTFELELQAVHPGVTLPYWDWTVDDSPAAALWDADFLGGDGRGGDGKVMDGRFAFDGGEWTRAVNDHQQDPPFLTRAMGQAADATALPTTAAVSATLGAVPYDSAPWEDSLRDPNDPSQWRGFRLRLEIVLHNLVHRWVGGAMMDMASPNDPVFWLHHANIDRLWGDWQRQHPDQAPYLPSAGGPTGHNLGDDMIFHAPAPWAGATKPSDVLQNTTIGVRYDTDPVAAPPAPPPAPFVPEPAEAILPKLAVQATRRKLPMFVLPAEIPGLDAS